jgi:hypothetical protein
MTYFWTSYALVVRTANSYDIPDPPSDPTARDDMRRRAQ